ncbi:MAG TPA: aminopeptidase P N-terminal domain-containing protein [Myxococcota bacterium]|nr:aminopeptidase P N-terminal domain-containing protein [Myxococcota bacterium]HPV05075.1 aminopeptidase P N-terminal domain-containing protein [Myxococcota bacterium]
MDKTRFRKRRETFFDMMEDGVALIPSGSPALRNGDVEYPFRASSDFFLLTGMTEPESWAVLTKQGQKRSFQLYVRPFDPEQEIWTGRRAGLKGARKTFGADVSHDVAEFFNHLPEMLQNQPRLYYSFGIDDRNDARILAVTNSLKQEARRGILGPWEIHDTRRITWRMRLTKDRLDILDQKKVACITAQAFKAAMRAVRPGLREYELASVVEFEFARRGGKRLAFDTICAAGANAATLHYTSNDAVIGPDDLVLVDAGAEHDMVTADITRTFPASGHFTKPQATAYQWVLKAQKAAIAKIRPGVTYAEIHRAGLEVLCAGLVAMKVLDAPIEQIIESQAYRPWFMHRIGHWLGLDCHDVGPYFIDGASIRLEPGMVITVEPGLYFRNQPEVPEEYRGIGIRIEDDVLVTTNGSKILTSDVPKEIKDIEAFMSESASWWDGIEPVSTE